MYDSHHGQCMLICMSVWLGGIVGSKSDDYVYQFLFKISAYGAGVAFLHIDRVVGSRYCKHVCSIDYVGECEGLHGFLLGVAS